MNDHELMVGPVAEALGVSRSWLLEQDSPLPETVDLPVSLLVELLNVADCLYNTDAQRSEKVRRWLSRISGRPLLEFDFCMPLLLSLRRQFRMTRDEDLSDVTLWRRKEARPTVSKAQVEITIRPENGSRLKKLAKQLGSPEAAVEFLLQMEEHCGKGVSQRRTRWPPKIHYESSRGQLKIDVGTELVCVVLSQFKPVTTGSQPPAAAAVTPVVEQLAATSSGVKQPAAADSGVQSVGEVSETAGIDVSASINGRPSSSPAGVPTSSAPVAALKASVAVPDAAVSDQQTSPHQQHPTPTLPPAGLALPSAYQTVVRDATLPVQMFADDDNDFSVDVPQPPLEDEEVEVPLEDCVVNDAGQEDVDKVVEDGVVETSGAGGDGPDGLQPVEHDEEADGVPDTGAGDIGESLTSVEHHKEADVEPAPDADDGGEEVLKETCEDVNENESEDVSGSAEVGVGGFSSEIVADKETEVHDAGDGIVVVEEEVAQVNEEQHQEQEDVQEDKQVEETTEVLQDEQLLDTDDGTLDEEQINTDAVEEVVEQQVVEEVATIEEVAAPDVDNVIVEEVDYMLAEEAVDTATDIEAMDTVIEEAMEVEDASSQRMSPDDEPMDETVDS